MHRIYKVECDVSTDSRVLSPLRARTFDSNANKIRVQFFQDGEAYSGYNNMNLAIRYLLPNGAVLEQNAAIGGDIVEVLIRNDVFNLEGTVEVELKVSEADFVITSSQNTYFEVKRIIEGDDIPPNTAFNLNMIHDVEVTGAANGDALVFEDGTWVNRPFTGIAGSKVITSAEEPTEEVDYWFDEDN